jgi:hypothetical protein
MMITPVRWFLVLVPAAALGQYVFHSTTAAGALAIAAALVYAIIRRSRSRNTQLRAEAEAQAAIAIIRADERAMVLSELAAGGKSR